MAQAGSEHAADDVLRASFDVGYTYQRLVGPVIGEFLTGLRDGKMQFVALPSTGTVKTWNWVNQPRPNHLLKKPFAWALVQIDGADTSLLHMVDAGSKAAMKTGMKVKVRWAAERKGFITDIECFEPA